MSRLTDVLEACDVGFKTTQEIANYLLIDRRDVTKYFKKLIAAGQVRIVKKRLSAPGVRGRRVIEYGRV